MTQDDFQGKYIAPEAPGDDGTSTSSPDVAPAAPPSQVTSEDMIDADEATLTHFWEAIKRLPSYLRLAMAIARDPQVPKQAKVVLGFGAGYAISPIDLVPGVIPVAGQLDDLYAVLTALQQSLKRMPDDVADRHLASSGVTRESIDRDLQTVRNLVRKAVVKTVKYGGKTLGRLSRAAYGFANEQLKRRNAGRAETPL